MFFLPFLGLLISIYFTGVYYGWFSPDVFWIPKICRLERESCLTVLETPRAKIFGIPNSVFGIAIYIYILLDQFFFNPVWGLILIGFALIRSVYLAYSLIFITKVPCVLCFTSHLVNLCLFLIYLKDWL